MLCKAKRKYQNAITCGCMLCIALPDSVLQTGVLDFENVFVWLQVGQVFHPDQDRIVSVRECARAQARP